MPKFAPERLIPGNIYGNWGIQEALCRYDFAAKFVDGKYVVDLGCGHGYGSVILSNAGAKMVHGMDISAEAIKYALSNYKSDKTKFSVGDITAKLPFDDNSVDVIVCLEVLEHLKDSKSFLLECNRVLKKDGIIICSSPNKGVISSLTENNPDNPYHLHEFFIDEFNDIVSLMFSNLQCFGQSYYEQIKITRFDEKFDLNITRSEDFKPKRIEINSNEKAAIILIVGRKKSDVDIQKVNRVYTEWQDKHKSQIISNLQTLNSSLIKEKNLRKLEILKTHSDPFSTLLAIYYDRPDLQRNFPEVSNGTYGNLVGWAVNVCNKSIQEKKVEAYLSKFENAFKEYLLENKSLSELTSIENNPLGAMLSIYSKRQDLQKSFPEVSIGNYDRLIDWMISVAEGQIVEEEVKQLISKFLPKYKEYLLQTEYYRDKQKLSEQIAVMQQKLIEQSESLVSLENDKDYLKKFLDSTTLERQKLSDQLSLINQKLSDQNSRLASLETDKENLQKLIDKTNHEKDSLSEQFNLITREKELLLQEKSILSNNLANLETKIKELQAPLSSKIIKKLKNETKESELGKIAYASLNTIEKEGFKSYLHHISVKIKRMEFKILSSPYGVDQKPNQTEEDTLLRCYDSYLKEGQWNGLSIKEIERDISQLKLQPIISLIMPVFDTDERLLREAIESVEKQIYQNWELCICDDASKSNIWKILTEYATREKRIKITRLEQNSGIAISSNKALEMASGEFIALLDHDDVLTNNALYEIVKSLNLHPDADYIYSDEDHIDEGNLRKNPFFKPDWSPELLRSIPYVSHLTVIRRKLVEEVGGFRKQFSKSPDYDLQLRTTDLAKEIVHVPKVLYSWRASTTSVSNQSNMEKFKELCKENLNEITDFVEKKNLGTATTSFYENTFRVKYKMSTKPLVSIIILTYDKVELLKQCLTSIQNKSTYKNIEIIIVTNNRNENSPMLRYLNHLPHRIVKYDGDFNWSHMNAVGVENSKGEFLLFLNDDTEVITADWLEAMLEFAHKDDVGAVGCRLFFPDGGIQHAGVTSDPIYVAYHPYKTIKGDGYYTMTKLPREQTAVTGACMMVRKKTFLKVGGFDNKLKEILNDVDFCWRLYKLGYRNIYTPFASLYHHEGASRYNRPKLDTETTTKDSILMLRRWRNLLLSGDPYHNYNMTNSRIDTYGLTKFFYPANQENDSNSYHILMISHNMNLEGATLGLFKIAKYLRSVGYSVTVVTPFTGKLMAKYAKLGIPVMIIPDFGHLCKIRNHDLIAFLHSFDFIIANTILYYFVGTTIKEPFFNIEKPEVIWIIRETPEIEGLCNELRITKSDIQNAFDNASAVVFLSNATRKYYDGFQSRDNVITINDCVDMEEFRNGSLEPSFKFIGNYFNVICVGTIFDNKGQDLLVDAAVEIITKHNPNFRFFFIGKVGNNEFYSNLVEKINKYNLKQIIFMGELDREDVYSFYENCDAVVMPSRRESFPTAVTEAMAIGKPIIATKIFGIVEQIQNGYDGILIDQDDKEGLVKSLLYLYNNENARKDLSKNANKTFIDKFSFEKMGKAYLNLFQKIRITIDS